MRPWNADEPCAALNCPALQLLVAHVAKAYLTMFGGETLFLGIRQSLQIMIFGLCGLSIPYNWELKCYVHPRIWREPNLRFSVAINAAAALVPQGMPWHLPFINKPAKRLSFVDVICRPGAAAQGHAKLGLMAHMGASCISCLVMDCTCCTYVNDV